MNILRKIAAGIYLIYGLLIFFGFMLCLLPFILLATTLKGKAGASLSFFFLRCWAWLVCAFLFIPVIYKNRSKVNKRKAYIYISNHNSYLDSPSVVISAPNAFKPLGKIEMSKIPGFGIIYKRVVVMIDRSSKESRTASVELLKKVLQEGISILIFPEGTMNTDLHIPLKDFYDGAFRIAIETQTPIAPFVIINARTLFPRSNPLALHPGLIHVYFADPVDVSGYTIEQVPELKERVFKEMENLILQHQY